MMSKCLIYGIGFFIATLLIQAIFYRIGKGKGKKWMVYIGTSVITGMCVIGLMQHEIAFLAEIIGFVTVDGIGEAVGGH